MLQLFDTLYIIYDWNNEKKQQGEDLVSRIYIQLGKTTKPVQQVKKQQQQKSHMAYQVHFVHVS